MPVAKTNVKKVAPYPIEVLVTPQNGEQAYRAKVIKVNTQGLFLETPRIYPLNTKIQVQFELPVLKASINETVIVRKTLDQYKNPVTKDEGFVRHLLECHFLTIQQDSRNKIFTFTSKINQKD